jgi:hypothetical protein
MLETCDQQVELDVRYLDLLKGSLYVGWEERTRRVVPQQKSFQFHFF